MRVRTETSLGFGALIALQLATSFAAIGLLGRVTPEVGQMLRDNVQSVEAVETMLAALATPDPAPERAASFRRALAVAEGNVTEPAERPRLARIDALVDPAVAGDAAARREVVRLLIEVAEINRASMRRSEEAMAALGRAGSWAAALLGIGTFGVGLVASRRLRNRLEAPLVELDEALEAARSGDVHRRVHIVDGPLETVRIAGNVNQLLERRTGRPDDHETLARERAVLLAALDAPGSDAVVLDRSGEILAASRSVLDILGHGAPWMADLASAVRAGQEPAGWTVTPTSDGRAWVLRRSDAAISPS